MAISRYKESSKFTNNAEQYLSVFAKKNIGKIVQYGSVTLRYPTTQELSNLVIADHEWKAGDRLFKLAHEHYDERSELWWVIAWFNGFQSEADIEPGTNLMIPLPLERVLTYFGV